LNRVIGIFRKGHKETINISKVEHTMTDLHNDYMLLSKYPKSLKRPLIWALLVNVTDLMTIYTVYIAFGSWINPGALILAYAVANFAGLVAILPGGVGIYEGLMTATLTSGGVDKALALSATVVYRVLNMMYFLPLGYFFYRRALKNPSSAQMVIDRPEHGEHIDLTKIHKNMPSSSDQDMQLAKEMHEHPEVHIKEKAIGNFEATPTRISLKQHKEHHNDTHHVHSD
jgi:hypothetical protein